MKFALFLLPKAEADIDGHCAFIGRSNPNKALEFDRAVFRSLNRLCDTPLIGAERSNQDPRLFGLRMWFVKGFEEYLIFYLPFGNYIEVVRVLHSRQSRDFIFSEIDKE